MRASDAERERIARSLGDHCAQGRITIYELDLRLERVYSATTRRELDLLIADLPNDDEAKDRSSSRRILWPGVAPFHERRHLRASVPVAYGHPLREIVPTLGMLGFRLVEDVPPRKLALAADGGLHVRVMFHRASDGCTEVSAFGEAHRTRTPLRPART